MKTVLIIIASIIGVLVLFAAVASIIGSRMPEGHTVSRSMRLNASPSDVYAVIRNFGESPRWRSDVKRVELLSADKFKEYGSQGTVTYQIVEDVPDRKIVTKIVDVDLGYSGSWECALEASNGGTMVTITERGVVSSPMFRFMSRYVFGHTATMDAYLKALTTKLP
jgi:hypothetical protein